MKRIIALALAVFLTGHSRAEESHPAVEAANNANVAFVQCVEKIVGAAEKISTESTRVMMIEGAPDKCAKNVRSPNVQTEPSGAARFWHFAGVAAGLIAQYKGQALIWGGLQAMMSRSADSTDKAIDRGFDTADKGIDAAAKDPIIVEPFVVEVPAAQ